MGSGFRLVAPWTVATARSATITAAAVVCLGEYHVRPVMIEIRALDQLGFWSRLRGGIVQGWVRQSRRLREVRDQR